MEVNQILRHVEHLNVENLYVGPIRLEKKSIINGCRKNQGGLIMYNFKVFVGLPVICKSTMTLKGQITLKN